MSSEIQAYIKHFQSLHEQLGDIIRDMPDDEVNWIPIEGETNSAAVLLTHMLGAESFRIREMAGGVDIGRDREAEFDVNLSSVTEMEQSLEQVGKSTFDVLSRLPSEELDQTRPSVRSYEGAETVRWHILHTIEHFAMHLGHLSLTRQLYTKRMVPL